MDLRSIKQRYEIIGNSPELDRAIEIAMVVSPTDLSVLISGESGTGKEVIAKMIHQNSARKHGPYNTLNCGAIPEGTIDSELFGHEKGSFTGAHEARKGYFEVTDGGTLFLDEVGELPLSTQVRLLRVLEAGEFIRVGSSRSQKTSVRVVAATNVDMRQALLKGTFREDLYYRLNAIPIIMPPLRERSSDIHLLFRWFAVDAAQRYRISVPISLTPDAQQLLNSYRWPGNVRQLRNIVEQMNVIEKEKRLIDVNKLRFYLPQVSESLLPALMAQDNATQGPNEREALYAVILKLQEDVNALNEHFHSYLNGGEAPQRPLPPSFREGILMPRTAGAHVPMIIERAPAHADPQDVEHTEVVEESLNLENKEKEIIRKALTKHRGRRKGAAHELGISERTLYRKIKEYKIT